MNRPLNPPTDPANQLPAHQLAVVTPSKRFDESCARSVPPTPPTSNSSAPPGSDLPQKYKTQTASVLRYKQQSTVNHPAEAKKKTNITSPARHQSTSRPQGGFRSTSTTGIPRTGKPQPGHLCFFSFSLCFASTSPILSPPKTTGIFLHRKENPPPAHCDHEFRAFPAPSHLQHQLSHRETDRRSNSNGDVVAHCK